MQTRRSHNGAIANVAIVASWNSLDEGIVTVEAIANVAIVAGWTSLYEALILPSMKEAYRYTSWYRRRIRNAY